MPTPDSYSYDVYVSYADADSAWVEAHLLPRLTTAGVRAIERRDFVPGRPLLQEQERAIQQSQYTLLILSSAYLASAWEEHAELLTNTQGRQTNRWRAIPLLIQACDLPLRLASLVQIKLYEDAAEGWSRLLAFLAPQQEGQSSELLDDAAYADSELFARYLGELPLYDYEYPVREPEMFFGRRKLLDDLFANFTRPRPRSFYLVGGRRIGKTSLLNALSQELDAREPQSGDIFTLPVVLDMHYVTVTTRSDFFTASLRALYDALEWRDPQLELVARATSFGPTSLDEVNPAELLSRFEEVFVAIRRALLPHVGILQVVLMVDETERILHEPWSHDLLSNLRSLISNRAATRGFLSLLMAGASDFYGQISGEGSPLRNVMTKKLLGVLDEEASRALIVEPLEAQPLSSTAVEAIMTQAGGHPYLTQYLMAHLLYEGNEMQEQTHTITPVQVLEAARMIWDAPETFEDWCQDIGILGLQIYNLLVQRDVWVARDEIFAHFTDERSGLRRALEALVYHGVIYHTRRRGYRVAGAMFRDWFVEFH